MLANGALLRQAITDAHAELDAERPRREAQLVQLDTEAKKVDLALDRYFDAFETGDLSPAACKKRVDDLVSRRFCSSNAGKISKPPPSEVASGAN